MPKRKPNKEFFSVFPTAIIMIPIVARIIDTHTFIEIFSLRNKKAKIAVKKGIAAKHNRVTAAVVFVIEYIKETIATPSPQPPINPDLPTFL